MLRHSSIYVLASCLLSILTVSLMAPDLCEATSKVRTTVVVTWNPPATSASPPPSSTVQTKYNYYVAANGSDDAGDGSQGNPWRTINHAVQRVAGPDTTIHVGPGIYPETVALTASGSSTAPFRIVSDSTWGAQLQGAFQIGSGSTQHGGDFVHIVGFDVTAPGQCEGIVTRGTYNQILNNRVHDVARAGCGGNIGGAGIALFWNGVADNYQGHNLAAGNVVDGVGYTNNQYVHGIYAATPYNTITNNIVSGVSGWGIHVYHYTFNEMISNNDVFNNVMGGILVSAAGSFNDGSKVIDNNTVVKNNIVAWNAGQPGIEEAWGPAGANNIYQNNLVYQNAGGNFSLQNGLSDPGAIVADPLFNKYTGSAISGDYRLQSNSPVAGRGIGAL